MSDKRNDNNKQNPIDKVFRDGLHDRPFEFDEKYWEQAQGTLSQFDQLKKSGKGGNRGLFWMLGGALLVIGFLAWFLLKPETQPIASTTSNNQQQEEITTENKTTENVIAEKAELPQQQQSPVISSQNDEKNENKSQVADNQSDKIENKQQIADKQSINEGSKGKKDNQNPTANTGSNNSNKATDNNDKTTAANNTTSDRASKQIDVKPEDKLASNNDVVRKNENQSIDQNLANNEVTPKEDIINNENEKADAGVAANNNSNDITAEEKAIISIDSNQITTLEKSDSTQNNVSTSNKTLPKKSTNIDLNWYGALSFGADFTSTALSSTNPSLTDWVNYRTAGETLIPTLGVSFEAGLNIKQFTVGTGINLYNYSSEADYQFTTITVDTIVEYIYDTLMVEIIDSFYIISNDTVEQNFSGNNTLSYWEIPLLVGYQFKAGNWRFGLSTGPSFAQLSNTKITYPNYSLQTTETLQPDYFKNSYFNWIAKPSVTYMFTDNIGFGINGMFRWNLGSIVENADIQQQYSGYGIQVGLRVEF